MSMANNHGRAAAAASTGLQVMISWAAVATIKVLGWKLFWTNRCEVLDSDSQSHSTFVSWACPKNECGGAVQPPWPARVRLRGCWMVGTTDERAGERRDYFNTHWSTVTFVYWTLLSTWAGFLHLPCAVSSAEKPGPFIVVRMRRSG